MGKKYQNIGDFYGKYDRHTCELNIDTYGLPRLPPNAPWYRKFGRKLRTQFTVDAQSAVAKRFFRNKSAIVNERKRHLKGHSFIIHPFSNANIIIELLFFFIWTWEIFFTPFSVGFSHYFQDNIQPQRSTTSKGSDDVPKDTFFEIYRYLISPFEIVMCCTFFITGYVNKKNKEIIIEPIEIVKNYLVTYFVMDFLAMRKPGIYSVGHVVAFSLRLCILFRTPTVLSFFRQAMLNFRVPEEVYACLKLFILTCLMLHLFTCAFYYSFMLKYNNSHIEGIPRKFPKYAWVKRANIVPANKDIWAAYRITLSMIVCHFFGAGLGKVPIQNLCFEGPFLILVMIVGRLWTLYVLAYMLKIFSAVAASESKYEEYLGQLEVFMRQKRLPKSLKYRLIEYFKYKYQYHYFNEKAMFSTLSEYLHQEIMLFRARKLIKKVELFKTFPRRIVGQIIGSSKQVIYLTNDVLAKQGDPVDEIYFISSGTVAVYDNKGQELAHLEDGEEVGLYSCLSAEIDFFRFNYVATETTEIYVVSKKNFKASVFDQEDLLKFFSKKLQDKIQNYFDRAADNLHEHKVDFLSDLRQGKILESRKHRETQFDDALN